MDPHVVEESNTNLKDSYPWQNGLVIVRYFPFRRRGSDMCWIALLTVHTKFVDESLGAISLTNKNLLEALSAETRNLENLVFTIFTTHCWKLDILSLCVVKLVFPTL